MITMNLMIFSSLMIMLIIFMMLNLMKKKVTNNKQKLSPFECGFQQFSSTRISFSIPYFLITLIFLIFDIEISILFPLLTMIINLINLNLLMLSFSMFFFILNIGLLIEWKNSAINWISI